jgi:tRNA threonylcarbamoyl adenosine modification protein (Sua5/YciO/YrdC/YwlC family)
MFNSKSIFLFRPDSIWGFSCKYDDIKSIKRIIEIKKRKENKPFIVLASSFKEIESIAYIEKKYKTKKLYGVSLILKSKIKNKYLVKDEKICVRIPSNKKAREFIKKTGMLVSTSANKSGQQTFSFYELKKQFPELKHKSFARTNKPSTILDLVEKKIVRQGNKKIKFF